MLSSRLAKDVPELCEALALNANVALRSLGMALGFGGFMVMLSPRLALLALLEVPLTIVAQKIYDTRQEVMVGWGRDEEGGMGTGWGGWDGDRMGTGWGLWGWGQDGGMGTGWGWWDGNRILG